MWLKVNNSDENAFIQLAYFFDLNIDFCNINVNPFGVEIFLGNKVNIIAIFYSASFNGLTSILTWMSNYIHSYSVDWNCLSIPKLQRWGRWSLEWTSNFISQFTGYVITYPCWH